MVMDPHLHTPCIRAGDVVIGGNAPPLVIAGPDTLESEDLALTVARELKRISGRLGIPCVFKGSYDKANRSSSKSYRGPGLQEGLRILRMVRDDVGLPVTSDVHTVSEVDEAARVLDILQIPAFLCRQNDLLHKAGDLLTQPLFAPDLSAPICLLCAEKDPAQCHRGLIATFLERKGHATVHIM